MLSLLTCYLHSKPYVVLFQIQLSFYNKNYSTDEHQFKVQESYLLDNMQLSVY